MFEGDSADTCASFDGGRAEGLACADPGARTPIGSSGIFCYCCFKGTNLAASDDELVHYLIKDDTNTSHLISVHEKKGITKISMLIQGWVVASKNQLHFIPENWGMLECFCSS